MAGLWLAGEMVDHIGIYGSKVAEGLSVFQRRSCYIWHKWSLSLENVSRVSFFFQNLKIWIFGKFLKFFGLDLEKKNLQFSMDSFHI